MLQHGYHSQNIYVQPLVLVILTAGQRKWGNNHLHQLVTQTSGDDGLSLAVRVTKRS